MNEGSHGSVYLAALESSDWDRVWLPRLLGGLMEAAARGFQQRAQAGDRGLRGVTVAAPTSSSSTLGS